MKLIKENLTINHIKHDTINNILYIGEMKNDHFTTALVINDPDVIHHILNYKKENIINE